MKIAILDGYTLNPCGDTGWREELRRFGELIVYDRTLPGQVTERCLDVDAVLTNKVKITASTITACPQLKYIGILATGLNVVDVAAAHRAGITVTNIPAYSTMSVAQMAFALLLGLTNRVEHYSALNRSGVWSRCGDFSFYNDRPVTELAGLRFGVYGMGNIGSAAARMAQAFGMEVCAVTSKPQDSLPQGVTKVDKDEFFSTCDVISLHCPLTPDTEKMINKDTLAKMKSTALLINTSRGGLVDEHALADALESGMIAGAAADVLATEPPAVDCPLLAARNFLVTPHIAWASQQACRRLARVMIDNLQGYLSHNPQNVVC